MTARLALFLDWITKIGKYSGGSTKICQKRLLFPRLSKLSVSVAERNQSLSFVRIIVSSLPLSFEGFEAILSESFP